MAAEIIVIFFNSTSEKFFLCKEKSSSMTSWQGNVTCFFHLFSKVNKSHVLSVPANVFLQHFMPFCKLTAPDNIIILTENNKGT